MAFYNLNCNNINNLSNLNQCAANVCAFDPLSMHRPLRKLSSKPHPKVKFTPEEDEKLRVICEQFGTSDWEFIADHMPGRNLRQCKERWLNYLSPDVNNNPWTLEEDTLLLKLHSELGAKWVRIANSFKGRSDTMIKNRFMVLQRRAKVGVPTEDRMPKQKEIKPSMNISQNLQPTQNQTQQFNYYNTMQQQQQNNFYQQTQQQMHQYISQPLPIQTPSQTIVNQAPKKVKTEPQPQVQQQQIDYPFSFSENEPNTVQNDENEVKAEDEMDFWSEMFNNTFEQGCEYDAFGWM